MGIRRMARLIWGRKSTAKFGECTNGKKCGRRVFWQGSSTWPTKDACSKFVRAGIRTIGQLHNRHVKHTWCDSFPQGPGSGWFLIPEICHVPRSPWWHKPDAYKPTAELIISWRKKKRQEHLPWSSLPPCGRVATRESLPCSARENKSFVPQILLLSKPTFLAFFVSWCLYYSQDWLKAQVSKYKYG